MRILGLDIATKCGWCTYDGAEYVTGVLDCSPKQRNEPEGARFLRFDRGMHYLTSDVDAAIIERTFSKGSRTAEILNGLTAIALAVLEARGIEYAFVAASSLKAFGREHGAIGKDGMLAFAVAELRRPTLTTDESDAYWLVKYWEHRLRRAA